VDEFHHATAASYQILLDYYKPTILLGFTATPERMDNKDVFKYFDHYVASGRLAKGEINFIFTVDIYNEGVDIPEINTVLFLRPTESMTIFLQQLGRGLRLSPNKEHLTVLDFIGQVHKNYRFVDKFSAIIEHGRHSLAHLIDNEIFKVPKGCYIKLFGSSGYAGL
jgi:superfamily II DNA or RNA helicase